MQIQADEKHLLEKQIKRYEDDEFGLTEAMCEIRELQLQLDFKNKQLEEVCRKASQSESEANEIKLENEHLREKLGIKLDEVIDLNGYRRSKTIKDAEEHALNVVLQKEVC